MILLRFLKTFDRYPCVFIVPWVFLLGLSEFIQAHPLGDLKNKLDEKYKIYIGIVDDLPTIRATTESKIKKINQVLNEKEVPYEFILMQETTLSNGEKLTSEIDKILQKKDSLNISESQFFGFIFFLDQNMSQDQHSSQDQGNEEKKSHKDGHQALSFLQERSTGLKEEQKKRWSRIKFIAHSDDNQSAKHDDQGYGSFTPIGAMNPMAGNELLRHTGGGKI